MDHDDYRDGQVLYPQLTSIPAVLAHIRSMGHTFLSGVDDPGVADMGTKTACEVCGGRIAAYMSRQPSGVPLLYKGRLEVDVDEHLLVPCARPTTVRFLWEEDGRPRRGDASDSFRTW
jgi:hypothetical protein